MIDGQFFVSKDFAEPAPAEHLFEITYVTGGMGTRCINGENQRIIAGNYFLSEPGNVSTMQDIKELSVIRLFFLASFLDPTYASARHFCQLADSYLLRFGRRIATTFYIENIYLDLGDEVGKIMEKICAEKAKGRYGHLEIIRCYAMEVILQIFRQCAERSNRDEDRNIRALALTYDYCQRYYNLDIKLSDMCQNLHYSLPYLSARFKEVNGCTFTQLVQKLRVEEACRLLLSTNEKVEDISIKVGYNDVQTFFKVFKKEKGATPLQYRKKHTSMKEV